MPLELKPGEYVCWADDPDDPHAEEWRRDEEEFERWFAAMQRRVAEADMQAALKRQPRQGVGYLIRALMPRIRDRGRRPVRRAETRSTSPTRGDPSSGDDDPDQARLRANARFAGVHVIGDLVADQYRRLLEEAE